MKPADLNTRIIRSSVDWSCAGITLADMLAGRFTYRSKAEWEKRIASGEITVNGINACAEQLLQLHDIIEYRPQDIVEPPADCNYRIVFEDENLLVIDKPGNLCMHPAGPFFKNTLWHLLCTRLGSQVHFINRLDRETSGLLIAAKNRECAGRFAKNKSVNAKHYKTIVHGNFDTPIRATGYLFSANSAIHKKRQFSFERPENPPFESSDTALEPLSYNGTLSLVHAELFTGRMHQIRATLCSLGFPVAGDKLYGLDEKFYLKLKEDSLTGDDLAKLMIHRQALHCCKLEFIHPYTGEAMEFDSELPEEMAKLLS